MKTALIVLAEGFEEVEAITAVDIMRRGGIQVTVAGLNAREVKAARRTVVCADVLLDDVYENDFDALILPGGIPGAKHLAASEKVTGLIKNAHAAGKLIAAICAAPAVVLVPTGILNGRSATCYPGEDMGNNVTHKEKPVVIDGHIITSRGVGTALNFALTIVEYLVGKEMADKVREAVLG